MEQYLNVNIREYIDREIKHIEDKHMIVTKENSRAVSNAKLEMDRRLAGMNEFREQLNKQSHTFLTRNEYDAKHQLVVQKVDMLSKLVYIGIGMVLILEVVFRFIIK